MTRLDRLEYKRWVEAFTDAFDDRDDLDAVIRFGTDYSLDYWVPDEGLERQIEILIRKIDDKALLEPVLDQARKRKPGNERLKAVAARLDVSLLIEPEDAFDAIRIFGDPMFDRGDFRTKLKLLRTDTVPPVLLVHGDRYAGKSWSIRLVSYGVRKSEDISLVLVDLKDYEGRVVDAAKLGGLITDEVDYEKEPPEPNEEMDSQWIKQYCAWLRREFKRAGGSWWLVIDDLEKVVLAESAKDFVYALGQQIPTSMPMVRLIIVSYHDADALATGVGTLERDPVPQLTMDEIREGLVKFFAAVYLERETAAGRDCTPDELQGRIAASTSAVLGDINMDSPKRLVQMGEAVRRQLART